jgi:hypothetical protein
MATCARAEPCLVPFSLRQALLTSKSATMVCALRAHSHGHGEMVTEQMKGMHAMPRGAASSSIDAR